MASCRQEQYIKRYLSGDSTRDFRIESCLLFVLDNNRNIDKKQSAEDGSGLWSLCWL